MKKNLVMFLLLLALALTACGAPAEPEIQLPTAPEHVDIGGTLLEIDTTELNLAKIPYDLSRLVMAARKLEAISRIDLGKTDLNHKQVMQLRAAFPQAQIDFSLEILGQTAGPDTEELDLSTMPLDQAQELLEQLPMLTGLKNINFVSEEGVCVFSLNDIPVLEMFRQALPDVKLKVSFELFGQTVTSEDEQIEYYRVPIGNDGVGTIRAVLPYLTSCQRFLMDGCGVDNEVMAQLREDFPQTKVVWRVWFEGPNYESELWLRRYSFLTDTEVIWTIAVSDQNADVLKYCVDTKYVDFGHDHMITHVDFLGYMPNLEVAILALTNVSDISGLAKCSKLEYLEIFTSNVTDLSPLANCKELKHLNIARLKIDDYSPLFELDKLERLRVVMYNWVSVEKLQELQEHLPNCKILDRDWDETDGGWRYGPDGQVPRYKLLREQMQYGNGHY